VFTTIFFGVAISVAAGFITKAVLDRKGGYGTRDTVTHNELVIGIALCTLVVVPLVVSVGFTLARANAVKYYEYWSDLESAAAMKTTVCTKDGPCVHEYDCDPYTATESYTVTVGSGDSRRTERRTRRVTKYHSCPYTTTEHTFVVTTEGGNSYTMGQNWFPANAEANRWRDTGLFGSGRHLPNVPSGEPALWVEAKERIDSGQPGGTTEVHDYKNYILASQQDIYAKASGAIDSYKDAGLMPTPSTGTYNVYQAKKVYFVGDEPTNAAEWQESLMRFNGSFGSERQGDMHLIVVTDPQVLDPDEYTSAVMAYWQDAALGKYTLSKNGYVVVIGSADNETVTWARGFSPMPVGNEGVAVRVRETLPGTALTPTAVLGAPTEGSKDGVLGDLMFAEADGFVRVEMAEFDYLFAQVQPSAVQKVGILGLAVLVSGMLWVMFALVDFSGGGGARRFGRGYPRGRGSSFSSLNSRALLRRRSEASRISRYDRFRR
jgi:hypothetical protein